MRGFVWLLVGSGEGMRFFRRIVKYEFLGALFKVEIELILLQLGRIDHPFLHGVVKNKISDKIGTQL